MTAFSEWILSFERPGGGRGLHALGAVVDAVRATADSLNVTLEQMKVVEEMRRTLRELRDATGLDSN